MTHRSVNTSIATGIVLLLVAGMLLPVFYMLLMSFRTGTDIVQDPLGLPATLEWGNYSSAWQKMNYVQSVTNSLVVTVAVTMLVSVLGALAAYPLARRTSRLARGIILLMALALATPAFVTITPIYVMFSALGLLDSYLGIILAFTALNLPLAVFFYTSFITTIPIELEEAARLDGCNSFQVFWHVVRPLLGPATATLSLFVMLTVWNDFTYPLLLLTDPDMMTVTVSVYRFVGNYNIRPEDLFPAAVLGSLPLIVLFIFFQRRILEGVTAGAMK